MTGVVRLQLINVVSVILILPITAFRIVTMNGEVRLKLINAVSVILIRSMTAFRTATMNGEVQQRLMNVGNVLEVLQTSMPVFRTAIRTGAARH